MLKSDVLSYLENMRKEKAVYANISEELFSLSSIKEGYKKGVEALEVAIEAVKAFEYDEYEEITVTLKAKKSPEGDDTYYCDFETGERLVIRGGELEGIYKP